MKSKNLLFALIFIIIFIFLFLKVPNDNKDSLKFNELNEKINEIEKLIKSSKKSFNIIKKALLEIKNNKNRNNLSNIESLLKIIQSSSETNQSINNLKWNKQNFKMCPLINEFKSEINMLNVYDNLDFKDIDGGVWKQGFELKYDLKFPQKLKVFIVPHSHQDPGWIKTYSDYFNSQTKPILDSMLSFLLKNKDMKFIYAEISFFQKWWHTLSNENKDNVKKIVLNKQLEIVTGGWVMTDEANSHYFSIINQLTDGHAWLKKHLDYSPKSSWSIDPFGYSELMPYILKKSGIDSLLIQRVHYIIKKEFSRKKHLEFLWTQSWDSKQSYSMKSQLMPFYSYDIPHTCGPDPSVCCQYDFIRKDQYGCPWGKIPVEITEANIIERATTLMDQYRKKSQLFDNGNILLIPLGDDFRYQTEKEWSVQYDNYKKLMSYMNSRKEWNIEVKFATLSEYFEAFDKEKLKHLPTLTGNMFSYADRLDHYWTGYFTSRPLLKSIDRTLLTNLRSAEIVLTLSLVYTVKYKIKSTYFNISELKKNIQIIRRTLSLLQHHDAIAGTAKNVVIEDYGNRVIRALKLSQNVFLQSAQAILEKNSENIKSDKAIFDLDEVLETYGEMQHINFVDLIHNKERYVYLFNSLGQPRQVIVNIPIKTNEENGIKIVGSGNQMMQCQLSPYVTTTTGYDKDNHLVSFKLNIGPLAFEQVKIIVSQDILSDNNCFKVEMHLYNKKNLENTGYKIINEPSDVNKPIIIQNLMRILYISQSTGNIEKMKDLTSDQIYDFKVLFKEYGARHSKEMSGAYIFLPEGKGKILDSENFPAITHFKGNLFDEVRVHYKLVIHTMKIYHVEGLLANAIDIENIIDIRETSNFELSMSVMTDSVAASDIFYTDSNCYQFIKRKTLDKLPVQANVYPMACGCYIESQNGNNNQRLSLFSKQPSGALGGKITYKNKVYSFLEVFQDRKLNQDDNRGLFEPVVDNKVTPMVFRIVFEKWRVHKVNSAPYIGELSVSSYHLLNDLTYPIHKLYVKSQFNNNVANILVSQKSLLTGTGLPCDYHMVNLRSDENGLSKLTLHRLKLSCDAKHLSEGSCNVSQRKSVLFKSLFNDLTIKTVNKASLTGMDIHGEDFNPEDISVNVMEMETFILKFDSK